MSDTPIDFASYASSEVLAASVRNDPRLRVVSPGERGHRGEFVVYWPQMSRRATSNAALSYAIDEANRRKQPLLVYEALRVDYPHASDRFHAFVLEGARVEAAKYRARGCGYAFFLPRAKEQARGVVGELAKRASILVTDDFPSFTIPAHLRGAAASAPCPLVAFDDAVIVPLSLFPKEEYAARTIRPKLLRVLGDWLRPIEENRCRVTWKDVALPFDPLDVTSSFDLDALLAALPIDHDVPRVRSRVGGSDEAAHLLDRFVRRKLASYAEDHAHPDRDATSHLSPYLHFGMIAPRDVALAASEARACVASKDAFLEELIVRRALAFNLAATNRAHATWEALPDWAKNTLRERASDRRPALLSREELERGASPDDVWNAAQRELRETGTIAGYLRMLWGKGVLAWKRTPREALEDVVFLNDKWALDGRDPNGYANILWCFGKHDRPWTPRPIFGTVRYMSTASARRKLEMQEWLGRWGTGRALSFDYDG